MVYLKVFDIIKYFLNSTFRGILNIYTYMNVTVYLYIDLIMIYAMLRTAFYRVSAANL